MNRDRALTVLHPFLRLQVEENIAIVRLTDDVLDLTDNLEAVQALRRLLGDLRDGAHRAVLCVATRLCFSPERSDRFWRSMGSPNGRQTRSCFFPEPMPHVAAGREENAFSLVIGWLISLSKPAVMTFQGDVALPFLGLGLACDYRLASGRTVFHNRCHELDIPPGAGLLYLLPAYVGIAKAESILLRARQIDAEEALALGLVEQLVPDDQIEVSAELLAAEAAKCSPKTVGAVKRLLRHHLPPLEAFFRDEMREIERALNGHPWKKTPPPASGRPRDDT